MTSRKTALQALEYFSDAYFVHRDLEGTLACISDAIHWIGTSKKEMAVSKPCVRALLEEEFRQEPNGYTYTMDQLDENAVTPQLSLLIATGTVSPLGKPELKAHFRLSCTLEWDETGAFCLHSVHCSLPTTLQDKDEYFPLSFGDRMLSKLRTDFLEETLPGGLMGTYLEEGAPFCFINDRMLNYLGYPDRATLTRTTQNSSLAITHPEDIPLLYDSLQRAYKNNNHYDSVYRMRKYDGSYLWVSERGQIIRTEGGRELLLALCFDVTREKEAEQALRLSEERFRIAMEQANIFIWEYDIANRRCLGSLKPTEHFTVPLVLEDFPESMQSLDVIHEDSIAAYMDLHRRVRFGEKKASADVQLKHRNGRYQWHKITYTTLFDGQGLPIRAIGTSEDLTEQKAAEQRYAEELAYREGIASDLIASIRLNLSQNTIEDPDTDAPLLEGFLDTPRTCTELFAEGLRYLPNKKEHEDFLRVFDRENMLLAFHEGKTSTTIEYRRFVTKDDIHWVSTTINLIRKPQTGDIIAFMYMRDINETKQAQKIIDAVIALDYDFICYIDGIRQSFTLYTDKREQYDFSRLPIKSDHYMYEVIRYARDFIMPEDVERCISEMTLENVYAGLEESPLYIRYYNMRGEHGETLKKKIQFSYIDRDNKSLLLTRTDLTDMYTQEQRKNDLLKHALVSAEQASVAKTEFLSRMSHEIRTPLNAIIGLSTLAAQDVLEPTQVGDSLSKIGISARYLLSLINDILDMSRIESGKLSLKQELIPFEEFINGVNLLMYPQAEAKGVAYDSSLTGVTDEYYIGDALKLQQILVNLLANAIKFTPTGGKVQLLIQQVRHSNTEALLKFTITDTGIGISETFFPKLFDPFAQEHTGTVSAYGGTGLGLPICKNLVSLMGGDISAQSIPGIGSEFTVSVKLGVSEQHRKEWRSCINLEGLKTLIVDDDVVVCEHTKHILDDMGIHAEWVDSGTKAIAAVARKWELGQYYNLILVDWKMPDMDGIETTRNIRKIVGPDVTIIIMTAYDWQQLEQEAKMAGVNLLMSKPMFRTSLCSAFDKVFAHVEPPEQEVQPEYDFSGKRILLVEDHPLNIEVAKKLLERKQAIVDIATNGLRALETFTLSPVGYYDAILMDIRMPVMDGLAAARNIRLLERGDSRTVPILAMTANAFEEDVDKSMKSGMNAHLAKPIDPALLYATLNQHLDKKDG